MKKGCGIALLIVFGIGIILIGLIYWAFQPKYKTVKIQQKIGGMLICKMEYYPDHHSWDYIINYEYETQNGEIQDLGQGFYSGREWNEDEQLVKVNDTYVLKTGNFVGSDKIIFGNIKTNNWDEYEFTPQKIENDSLWKTKKIKSLVNYWPSEAYINVINNNKIYVTYKYRIDPKETELTETKLIEYNLKEKPIINKITNYNNGYK
ncbi:hypothetical protein ACFO3U_08740 [Flavobacterium ponti]|uniref:Uncharacterized protein n=1 Tax=Flavobacterium ponti TaxID=665133 RepID=A0ABV9P5C3_9FLAO